MLRGCDVSWKYRLKDSQEYLGEAKRERNRNSTCGGMLLIKKGYSEHY